ncbi:ATP-binding protein [Helcococcus ovis]|uniref:ATP-binding protein n=2 Tax=Helcococcus ovis TaxID=72026 RepID=UPI00106F5AFC|nr:ATP-binding protein [Helcococcus ovis]TFF68121.1 ATP-binding protein [Helcococcus ovis]WNZ01979.1 ATP-binding protein [Helcococcus ovis]
MKNLIKTYNFNKTEENLVYIETIKNKGMIKFTISGLISKSISEGKDRIYSTFKMNGLKFPYGRVITNLFPADIKKQGTHYDLPIALSILVNQGYLKYPGDYLVCGELSLNGDLVEIDNPIRIINFCLKNNIKNVIMPYGDYPYLSLYKDINIYMARNISEVINHFNGKNNLLFNKNFVINENIIETSINDILSQKALIRALIISISGNHSILIKGPVGTGKTFSIKSIKSLFLKLNSKESLILSDILTRFYKSNTFTSYPQIIYPKNNVSVNELFGNERKIGTCTMSNFGFLVFDELNTFNKNIIDKLKSLLDFDEVIKFNKKIYYEYPVKSTIIATMNPCPCGNYGTDSKCICTEKEIQNYIKKIDKALLDRFNIKLTVTSSKNISNVNSEKYDIEIIKSKIDNAKKIQLRRYDSDIITNGSLKNYQIKKYINVSENINNLLEMLKQKYNLSQRSVDNILKVSRTIADYEGHEEILEEYVFEALNYIK